MYENEIVIKQTATSTESKLVITTCEMNGCHLQQLKLAKVRRLNTESNKTKTTFANKQTNTSL